MGKQELSNPEEVIKNFIKFMNNTNEMIAKQELRLDNMQLDIDKLMKYKNNGAKNVRILSP